MLIFLSWIYQVASRWSRRQCPIHSAQPIHFLRCTCVRQTRRRPVTGGNRKAADLRRPVRRVSGDKRLGLLGASGSSVTSSTTVKIIPLSRRTWGIHLPGSARGRATFIYMTDWSTSCYRISLLKPASCGWRLRVDIAEMPQKSSRQQQLE